MQIKLWDNFKKAPGSTKVPSGGTTKEVEIHNAVSITSPVIKLEWYHNWNYAYIPYWERYYFVTDIGYEHGFTYLYLQEDVLASNRQSILASSQYVTRSVTLSNLKLIDTTYPTTNETKYIRTEATNPYTGDGYIIQIDGLNGAKSIWLTSSSFDTLMDSLWQDYSGEGGDATAFSSTALRLLKISGQFTVPIMLRPTLKPSISVSVYGIGISPALMLPGRLRLSAKLCPFPALMIGVPRTPQFTVLVFRELALSLCLHPLW